MGKTMKLFNRKEKRSKKDKDTSLPLYGRQPGQSSFYEMTTEKLLANTTVTACVSLIADSIALLSCHVYKRTSHGRERDDRPSLAYCLQTAPNYYDTPFTFFQTIGLHLTLKGNAFIFIDRYPDYSVKALTPLDPDAVDIRYDEDGEIYFLYYYKGNTYKYTTEHVLHIPAYRYNTLRGLSPMEYAQQAARLGLTLDEYTADAFDGGIQSKLLIKVPQDEKNFQKEDAMKLTDRIMAANAGRENRGKPLIMAHGYEATPLNLSTNADAQLAENRSYSEKEVAKIYRVPLYMLGKDDSKFTNQEQANTFFLQHTLTPWLVRIQQYFDRLLTYPFRNDHYVEFDTDSMLRADYKSRMEMYSKGLQSGIYTPNQIYIKENLPTVQEEWGDKHFMPVNLSTVDKIATKPLEDNDHLSNTQK